MNVDVSPDGKAIVFDLLGDLYTVPITGGTATRLTSGPAFDTEPVFSPDGRRIAFISDRSGSDNIWLIDADGQNAQAFTHETTTPVQGAEWLVAKEFVLVARKAEQYWMYRADGTGIAVQPLLRFTKSLDLTEAAWSRDGRLLYSPEHTVESSMLWRVDVAQGTAALVSMGTQAPFRLAVSPDGRRVVFGYQRKNRTGLRLLDVATQEHRDLVYPLPDRDNSYVRGSSRMALPRFAFTPDGRAIILATGGTLQRLDVRTGTLHPIRFRATVEQELRSRVTLTGRLTGAPDSIRTIREAQRDSGGVRIVFTALGKIWLREGTDRARPLVVDQPGPTPTLLREPALSPDGRTVVYATWNDMEGGQLWRVAVRGGTPRQLTTRRGVYRHPVWSPDGTQLAVVREDEIPNRNGAATIAAAVYVLPATGGAPRRIATSQADDVPVFSADGQAVLVVVRPMPDQPIPSSSGVTVPTVLAVALSTGAVDTLAMLPAAAEQVAISSDGQSIAYTSGTAVYIARIGRVAGLPPMPATVTESGGLWPATRLADDGGHDLRWEGDGRTLTWVRAGAFVRMNVARARTADAEVIPLAAPRARPESTVSVALEGATVITMRGDEVLRDATVLVTGARIAAVGPRGSVPLPPGVHRIDVTGKTIIPGLINLRETVPFARDLLEGTNVVLAANLASGITTVRTFLARDGTRTSSALDTASRYVERLEIGTMVGARLLPAGAVTAAEATELTGLEAARTFMQRQRALGVAAVAQMAPLSRGQRQWLAAAAREAGVALIGESGDLRHALTMVIDGYHTLQGTIPNAQLHEDVRRFLAAAQTVYVPTLLAATGGRPGGAGTVGTAEEYFLETTDVRNDPMLRRFGLESTAMAHWRVPEDYHFRMVGQQAARLAARGTPVAVGTAGKWPGLGVHWELWALGMSGFSAHEALRTATAHAAAALGLGEELGTIEPGKVADLVVLDADPLRDLRQSRATRYVMKCGNLFDATTLAMLWPRITPPLSLRDTRYDPPPAITHEVAHTADSLPEATR